jgi:uncharacterized protein YcbK (DUF882 family)
LNVPVDVGRLTKLTSSRSRVSGSIALAALFVLFGSQNLQNAIANGDTRALSLYHTHTGEDLTVTFKRNGRYDEDGLKKLNWFLRDWRNDEPTRMDPHLFDIVWEVQRDVGAKKPVEIISAYRSPSTNAMLRRRSRGVAQFSQHMHGRAMDFFIADASLSDIRAAGLRLQRGGVGFYPTSGSPFVHVDTGSVRHWPRMTREQLVRVFPDGKTVHLPSDGHPLPGYALALAEIERRGNRPSAVSLASAEKAGVVSEETVRGIDASQRNLFAKLLAWAASEEDDDAEAAGGKAPAAAPAAIAARPAPQVLASIPLPRNRPERPGEFRLASAAPTAMDVINTRGFWRGEGALPAAEPNAAATPIAFADSRSQPADEVRINGGRLLWTAGPQGQPNAAGAPMPRPRQVAVASLAPAETTASVAPRAGEISLNDRMPFELALAYAGKTAAEAARPASIAAMQRDPAAGEKGQPSRRSVPVKPGQSANDPWLRAVVMAPSVNNSMKVAIFGAPDHRAIHTLMNKPRMSIALSFSHDPYFGMTCAHFTGAAVAFLPTVSFMRTASLY